MGTISKEIIIYHKNKGKGYIFGNRQNMKESLKKMRWRVKLASNFQRINIMRAGLKMEKGRAMGYIAMKMEMNIEGSGKMIRK